jgi:hypothetical protein
MRPQFEGRNLIDIELNDLVGNYGGNLCSQQGPIEITELLTKLLLVPIIVPREIAQQLHVVFGEREGILLANALDQII